MLIEKNELLTQINDILKSIKENNSTDESYTVGYENGITAIKNFIESMPVFNPQFEYILEDRVDVLDTAKETVTQDRVDIYGEPENAFKKLADYWTDYIQGKEVLETVDVCNMMILLKISRSELNPFHIDNYVDMAGYAACAGEEAIRLEKG